MPAKNIKLLSITILFLICGLSSGLSFAGDNEQSKGQDEKTLKDQQQAKQQQEKQRQAKQKKIKFDIWEFTVEGNSLLDKKAVELMLYPYLGQNKNLDTLREIQKAVQSRYVEEGYHTVIVEVMLISDTEGKVKVKVTEGKVGRIRVKDSDYFLLSRIKNEIVSLKEGRVPHMPSVQVQLGQLNSKTPDRIVTPYVKPGRRPGTVDFDLKVKDRFPLHFSAEINDKYSEGTEKYRASVSIKYNNLWQKEHSASLQYLTTPEDMEQINVLSGTYLYKKDMSDVFNVFYAVSSDSGISSVGDFGQSLNISGDGIIFGYRRISTFTTKGGLSHSLTLGADYKDFIETITSDVVIEGVSSVTSVDTPIDYLMLSSSYALNKRWSSSMSGISLGVNFGVRELLNEADEFAEKRYRGRPNFMAIKLGLNHHHEFSNGMTASASLDIQVADSPLVSNERYSIGGATSVRGYTESQISGDNAVLFRSEVRSPQLGKYISEDINELTAAFFTEAGSTHEKRSLPVNGVVEDDFEIYSAGVNLSFGYMQQLSITLDWATPLKAHGEVEKNESRTHFSLKYEY